MEEIKMYTIYSLSGFQTKRQVIILLKKNKINH